MRTTKKELEASINDLKKDNAILGRLLKEAREENLELYGENEKLKREGVSLELSLADKNEEGQSSKGRADALEKCFDKVLDALTKKND